MFAYDIYIGHVTVHRTYTETGRTEPESRCVMFWNKAANPESAKQMGIQAVAEGYPPTNGWEVEEETVEVTIIPPRGNYTIVISEFSQDWLIETATAWLKEAIARHEREDRMWNVNEGQYQLPTLEGELFREFSDPKLKELGATDVVRARAWLRTALANAMTKSANA